MPFLSEYLYHKLSKTNLENCDSIMISKYPKIQNLNDDIEKKFNLVIESIVSIRRAKALIDLANSKIEKAYIKLNDQNLVNDFEKYLKYISTLSKCKNVELVNEKMQKCASDVSLNLLESFISFENIDLSAILQRLSKQKEKTEKEINKLNNMLNNEKFIKNAPKEIIEQNQSSLNELNLQLAKINEELKSLQG